MKRILTLLLVPALCLGLSAPALAAEFPDVPATYLFHQAIQDCVEKKILSGYDAGTFRPTEPVTRAQFCVMLVRAFYPGQDQAHAELKPAGWFLPSAAALNAKDIMFYGEKYWKDPSLMSISITRMDMAQFIANIMKEKGYTISDSVKAAAQGRIADYASIDGYYQDAVKTVFALGIITGYGDGTFGPHDTMTRGQGAVIIQRMAQCLSGSPESAVSAPEQPAAPTTLANWKAVTEENVLEIINGLRETYPENFDFSGGYPLGNSSPVRSATPPYPRAADPQTPPRNLLGCGG